MEKQIILELSQEELHVDVKYLLTITILQNNKLTILTSVRLSAENESFYNLNEY